MTTGPTLPHLQTALSISLPDKGQPRRPERKQSWPRVQSWTTGDFSQVPSVSTNLEEHPPPELSGRMETPCEPGPVGRHQACLPAELWKCGQSNQTSALVISLYSNEFKFTCKTGYSYWFEHVAPEQPRLCLPSPDLSEEHRHGKTGPAGVTHTRAQDQSPQTQEAAGGRAGAGTECSAGTELQSGKKNKSRKYWR